eukprot:9853-Heterococcus_DN1.PRE.1
MPHTTTSRLTAELTTGCQLRCCAGVTATTDAAATTVTAATAAVHAHQAAEKFAKKHQPITDDIARREANIKNADSAERGGGPAISNTRCAQSSNMLAGNDEGRLLALCVQRAATVQCS